MECFYLNKFTSYSRSIGDAHENERKVNGGIFSNQK